MITYSYKVTKIKCIVKDDLLDYIKFVHYEMIAEENGIKVSIPMYACLPNVEDSSDFKPYNQTTEEEVINWCNEAVGQAYLDQMKSVLAGLLDDIFSAQGPYEKDLVW